MFNLRTLARILLAGVFVVRGWDALQDPKSKQEATADAAVPFAEKMGMPAEPAEQVRIVGAAQVVAGFLLAVGWMPRLAALVLGASLVPSTMANQFWTVDDPEERKRQMLEALGNASVFGGLLLAALDHGGRPSVFWTTGRAARKAGSSVSDAMTRAGDSVSDAWGKVAG